MFENMYPDLDSFVVGMQNRTIARGMLLEFFDNPGISVTDSAPIVWLGCACVYCNFSPCIVP